MGDTTRRVVVLGASGLVGSAVAARYARHAVDLRLVSRRVPPTPPSGAARVSALTGDLTDPVFAARAVDGADLVFHLVCHRLPGGSWQVGEDDPVAEAVNTGTVRSVAAALARRADRTPDRPLPTVVLAGSSTQPEDPGAPGTTPYDRHKSRAEGLLARAEAAGELRAVTLRLSTVYGPAAPPTRDHGVVSAMVRRALAGEALTVWGDGSVPRDPLHVADAARAFEAAGERPAALRGLRPVVGSGRPVRLDALFSRVSRTVAEVTGRPPVPVVRVPPPEGASAADATHTPADPGPFAGASGWSPRIGLTEGLRDTVLGLWPESAPA
ncbi:NAD-dependent epimerase/dehydratase family protein [Nocardiopsis sp. NPDC006938]|uniref:NAD-dependent epimerase/dehydratase family protein n=1 Tax=Nocardiopsis sp. NPDC006938 TaxID=3364337 RepID=UPI0036C8DEB3